jgi:hypothetical protein
MATVREHAEARESRDRVLARRSADPGASSALARAERSQRSNPLAQARDGRPRRGASGSEPAGNEVRAGTPAAQPLDDHRENGICVRMASEREWHLRDCVGCCEPRPAPLEQRGRSLSLQARDGRQPSHRLRGSVAARGLLMLRARGRLSR